MGPSVALTQPNLLILAETPSDGAAFASQFLREAPALQRAVLAALVSEVSRRPLIASLRELVDSARRLQLDAVADDLRQIHTLLQTKGVSGDSAVEQRDEIESAFARISALLELEADREPTPTSGPVRSVAFRDAQLQPGRGADGTHVMVVAQRELSDGLTSEDWGAADGFSLNVERIVEVAAARQNLRSGPPDVLVVDTRLEGAHALIEEVLSDLQLGTLPVIALGTFKTSEDSAELLVLGAARVLAMPASPAELRRACLEVAPSASRGAEPIGEVSMDSLGVRLASELQRGLCDAVDDRNRRRSIDYGQGAEILTTLYEAVARIRELVTASSAGAVRFANDDSVVAALPRAHWLDRARPRRAAERSAGDNEIRTAEDTALSGFRVLVAEDDPSTNWFLSGVLRDAGATVIEAMDGSQALLRAYSEVPDLVLTDMIMPETSGLRVCQAVKRDVVLHSVPVLLLSWKNDMLQRMRELDFGADGYLLKEASASEILQRVREVLRPYAAIAKRLREDGAVRGRMDALGAYALLRLVCRERPDATLTLRDAHFLYAIEIRGGTPVAATMTDEHGATLRGIKVLWSMLGVRGGRFGVENNSDGIQAELSGTIESQLAQPIARARAAQRLLSGRSLLRIKRVEIDAAHVRARAEATPEPALGILRALAAHTSPRELISNGVAAASLVEKVLSDAARYGAVNAVIGEQGQDVFEQTVLLQLDVLGGKRVPLDVAPAVVAANDSAAEAAQDEPAEDESAESHFDEYAADEYGADDYDADDYDADDYNVAHAAERSGERDDSAQQDDNHASKAGDGNGLVAALVEPPQAAIEEPAAMRYTPVLATRVNAPTDRVVVNHHSAARDVLPSLPSEPVPVPTPATVAEPVERQPEPVEEAVEPPAPRKPREVPAPRVAFPSDYRTRYQPKEPSKGMSRYAVPVMFALVGLAIAITARWWREKPATPQPPAPQVGANALPPAETNKAAQNGAPNTAGDSKPDKSAASKQDGEALGGAKQDLPVELPLTPAEQKKLKKGEGMLEVVAGRSDKIYIDGQLAGRGPVVKKPFVARDKPYEIKVKMRGEERVRYVVVKPSVRTRLRIAPPWTR